MKRIVGKRLKKNTSKTAYAGIASALIVIILFIGSLFDIADISTAALCGIIVFISLYKTDIKYSAFIYSVSSIIAFIIVPQKSPALFFSVICGIYPFIWFYAIKIKKTFLNYLIKLLIFNFLFAISVLFLRFLLMQNINEPFYIILFIILFANIAFIIYDYLLSVLWFHLTGAFYGIIFKKK